MDVLDLLIADHRRVRGMFTRCKDASENDDMAKMQELAAEIFEDLEVHTTIEEEIFYPWARDLSEEIAETINEGVEEHHLAKITMQECQQGTPGSDEWVAKITVLMENVEHHAGEEEKELFPDIRKATSADDRAEVAERTEARKAALGAPVLADKIDLPAEQLRKLASEQEIPGRSSLSHEELAATVKP